jgi:hypothetical protein
MPYSRASFAEKATLDEDQMESVNCQECYAVIGW